MINLLDYTMIRLFMITIFTLLITNWMILILIGLHIITITYIYILLLYVLYYNYINYFTHIDIDTYYIIFIIILPLDY
jgi:uncharacterized membrane protein